MPRPEVGKIYLVNRDGGIVWIARFTVHPLLRERQLTYGGILYEQSRQDEAGDWVYREVGPVPGPDDRDITEATYPGPVPAEPVTWGTAFKLIDLIRLDGGLGKLADLRSVLEQLQKDSTYGK